MRALVTRSRARVLLTASLTATHSLRHRPPPPPHILLWVGARTACVSTAPRCAEPQSVARAPARFDLFRPRKLPAAAPGTQRLHVQPAQTPLWPVRRRRAVPRSAAQPRTRVATHYCPAPALHAPTTPPRAAPHITARCAVARALVPSARLGLCPSSGVGCCVSARVLCAALRRRGSHHISAFIPRVRRRRRHWVWENSKLPLRHRMPCTALLPACPLALRSQHITSPFHPLFCAVTALRFAERWLRPLLRCSRAHSGRSRVTANA